MMRIGYRIGDRFNQNRATGIVRASINTIQSVRRCEHRFCMLLEHDLYCLGIPYDTGYIEDDKRNRCLPLQCMTKDIALVYSLYEPCFDEKERFAKVMTIHDLIPVVHSEWFDYGSSWGNQFMKSARNADRIVADSEYTKKDIIEYFKIAPEKIKVVYLGVDSGLERSVDAGTNFRDAVLAKYHLKQAYLLSVCTLEPRKNLVRLIRGFEQFKAHHRDCAIKLVIVGRKGWLLNEIASYVSNQDVLADIVVTGYVSDEELAGLYAGCMAVAYVSLYEGFGLPVLEGMYYKKPVITSNVTSIPEVGGDAVIYCDPYETDSIENAMEQVVDRKVDIEALCRRAAQRAKEFTYRKTADGLLELYTDLLG